MSIKLYKVGGFVRDQILGVKSKDIDYAVEAKSYSDMVEYIKSRGTIYLESPEFFTVRAKLNGEDADFVLCRKEGTYSDGRRPDSVEVGTIYDDLARRDFTMNAIAIDEEGNYLDPFDGRLHIAQGKIHCVGDTYKRFEEDALRLLRAIRFYITKDMLLSSEIHDSLENPHLVDLLWKNVSTERIREEMHKCFAFNTYETLLCLQSWPRIRDAVFLNKNVWLMPTSKKA